MQADTDVLMQANGRAASPPQSARLHVSALTRNVTGAHVQEIFSTYGKVKSAELAMDRTVNLPRGFAYVEFENRQEAEAAQAHMDGGQIDGNTIRWGEGGNGARIWGGTGAFWRRYIVRVLIGVVARQSCLLQCKIGWKCILRKAGFPWSKHMQS